MAGTEERGIVEASTAMSLLLLLLLFWLCDGGGAYLGVLAWKKDRIDICDGLLVVGSDMASRQV